MKQTSQIELMSGQFQQKKLNKLIVNQKQIAEALKRNACHNDMGILFLIALFTVNFSYLHYNVIQRGCEAISG